MEEFWASLIMGVIFVVPMLVAIKKDRKRYEEHLKRLKR